MAKKIHHCCPMQALILNYQALNADLSCDNSVLAQGMLSEVRSLFPNGYRCLNNNFCSFPDSLSYFNFYYSKNEHSSI